jgi:hypothetical protein
MQADNVELSWDADKSKWLVRIETGEEVIRRFCDVPQKAGEPELRSAAQKLAQDEGYEVDLAKVTIRR